MRAPLKAKRGKRLARVGSEGYSVQQRSGMGVLAQLQSKKPEIARGSGRKIKRVEREREEREKEIRNSNNRTGDPVTIGTMKGEGREERRMEDKDKRESKKEREGEEWKKKEWEKQGIEGDIKYEELEEREKVKQREERWDKKIVI
ncbi:hypothetical protein G5I_04204 [Acromyrmex echinatior]|uniref:Uncharacterized protein n=1 Tax=Acromyrmex echinatior TaxID=103372 RepID=F4WEZ8_ACREC|nr:hypothetical protein G5I_04204 [Acromyrmex echinatior]